MKRLHLADKASLPRLGGPHRLVGVKGMTSGDWERAYWAYQGFIMQVRAIVREVEERNAIGVE